MSSSISILGKTQKLSVYIGESDRWRGRPLYLVILEQLKSHGMAGATVTRGIAGFGARSRIHTYAIERLSEDLPLRIDIIDEQEKISKAVEYISPLVTEGMITLEDVQVIRYTHRLLNPLPNDKLVSEVMTQQVVTLRPEMSISQAWMIMLKHLLKAMPVINEQREVIGMITDEDMLEHAQLRPALAAKIDPVLLAEGLQSMRTTQRKVSDLMSKTVITARADEPLGAAVARLAEHGLKRMPVLDENNRLVGVLSRVDILRQLMDKTAKTTKSPEGIGLTVGDVMYPKVPTIQLDASLADIVNALLESGLRRLIVVDEENRPVGLISDGDVITRVAPQEQKGVLAALRSFGRPPQSKAIAQTLMSEGVLTATPETPLLEAARSMIQEKRKWLVVVDSEGKVQGLVDRQVLLRAIAIR